MVRLKSQRLPTSNHFEPLNNVPGPFQCGMQELPWRRKGDLISVYFRHQVSIDLEFSIRDVLESDTQKFRLSFEKVAGDSLSEGDSARASNLYVAADVGRSHPDDMQSAMPVFTREVVDVLQETSNLRLLCIGEFMSVARLYRLNPVLEFLREWVSVKCAVYEVSGLGINGKVQAAFIGGRMGSGQQSCEFECCSVKSRSQLIEKLAKFERDVDPVANWLSEDSADDSYPFTLHLNGESAGVICKKVVPEVCGSLSVTVRPCNSFEAIGKP